eukprot:m.195298 g.195298  ORF g.195298 m.195298 type:complete len:133 (+) comp53717_c0_seq3:1106-1504(+)
MMDFVALNAALRTATALRCSSIMAGIFFMFCSISCCLASAPRSCLFPLRLVTASFSGDNGIGNSCTGHKDTRRMRTCWAEADHFKRNLSNLFGKEGLLSELRDDSCVDLGLAPLAVDEQWTRCLQKLAHIAL